LPNPERFILSSVKRKQDIPLLLVEEIKDDSQALRIRQFFGDKAFAR
jgi:hypothetical protein